MALYRIDLHTHTTASDGVLPPAQLVQRAAERGVTVLGITDHDTLEGLAEAEAAGQAVGLEIVPGVEFTTRHERDKHFIGIHLLGYFINYQTPSLVALMTKVKQGRIDQKIRQIELLQSFGFDIPVEAVFERVVGVPGRPHIAAVLMERHPGRFATTQDIYDEYLGSGAKAHVGRQFALTVGEATAAIKEAGGLPVLAHPGAYSRDIDPLLAVRNAKVEGVEGVEVFYPYGKSAHAAGGSSHWVEQLKSLSRELNLLQTGGTDFHGRSHEIIELGAMGLTRPQYTQLKQGWQQLRGTNVIRNS
jgi:predicted metal-dependent phosphoesterase TrpH